MTALDIQTFTAEADAKHAAKIENEKPSLSFCPLICNFCRKNCECYVLATVRQGLDNIYNVSPGYCSNAMFSGSECNYV